MNKPLEYGDVIEVRTTNSFWTSRQKMFIIAPEGDGELGLREHAVCFKLGGDGKPDKSLGAYEVPWIEMDWNTLQDAAELVLNSKVTKLTKEVKEKSAAKANAEKMLNNIKKDKDVFIRSFAEEIG